VFALLLLASFAGGCRQDMYDQAKVKPLAASAFYPDGAGARPLPPNTIPRGFLRTDRTYWTGLGADGKPVDALPVKLDRALLERGQRMFNVYCSPCHDRTGSGNGMIVRRGYKQPPSFHVDRLRGEPVGYFVTVMSNGFGEMPSYASQVPIADRWAIAAYVKALQRSRDTALSQLTAAERAGLAAAGEAAPAEPPAGPEGPVRR
jgi:mono/diheme cytochrome c family protein